MLLGMPWSPPQLCMGNRSAELFVFFLILPSSSPVLFFIDLLEGGGHDKQRFVFLVRCSLATC